MGKARGETARPREGAKLLYDRFQSDQEQNDPRSDRQGRHGNVVLAHGSFANHRGKEKGQARIEERPERQAASKLRVSLAGQLHKRTQNFERAEHEEEKREHLAGANSSCGRQAFLRAGRAAKEKKRQEQETDDRKESVRMLAICVMGFHSSR